MIVDSRRLQILKDAEKQPGPVVYWMQRDQRAIDNWALLYAQEYALTSNQPLIVVFCLVLDFLGASIRQYGFMIRGLAVAAEELAKFNIPFTLLHGLPHEVIPGFLNETGAGLLVTDFNPLKIVEEWKKKLSTCLSIPFHEIDAHNIIPCRHISDKAEYAAFTIRKKVERLLPGFLSEIPMLLKHQAYSGIQEFPLIEWAEVMKSMKTDREVAEVDWLLPGENAASEALVEFLKLRLNQYHSGRNFPDRKGQSDLSPYLHFGHLSTQRVALEILRYGVDAESKKAFLEELIVRRELADNFCLHNTDYDNFNGFTPWAKTTLNKHRNDTRDYNYTAAQFENALTHDDLWNAAQLEMLTTGKMHGFMRMYWAKKILEWTSSPEEAIAIAIWLNDKYELDGRDPNGYAGIAWAIGGTHDRPWGERGIYGMIRYMNYQGCKRKFDVAKYISNILQLSNRKSPIVNR